LPRAHRRRPAPRRRPRRVHLRDPGGSAPALLRRDRDLRGRPGGAAAGGGGPGAAPRRRLTVERPRHGDPETGPLHEQPAPFPSYEELAPDLLEALDGAGLTIDDVRHELEPGVGERRFECTVRLAPADPPSHYHAHLTFSWDALMTYVAAYGPGADCDLYHD